MNYNTCTLSSGLRVIHQPSTSAVIYCGIAVGAGTRDELPGEEGLAHFCEHLAFKGTEKRSAVQLINTIEGVGGELNAFTNKEDTVYYCAIHRNHFHRAVDVLCDIVFHSQYPQHEVEKEREVVCDEIESYEDSPAELIFDDIENVLFEGHPLGHNILGTLEQVRGYESDDAKRFVQRLYQPSSCVFFASGDVDFRRLVRIIEAEPMPPSRQNRDTHCETAAIQNASQFCRDDSLSCDKSFSCDDSLSRYGGLGRTIVRDRNTHQAHVVLGAPAYSADDQRRWALYLLNNILGGPGLNSRLNLSLRERNGLVYSVESSMVAYRDCGLWTIYFGCDPTDISRCRRLVRHELDRLMQRPLNTTQLRSAQRQLEGQLAIACDTREQFALDFARNYLHTGKERDLTCIMRHISALTPGDLQQTAQELFAADRITTLIYQ